jgi:polyhydroxyalkanoate synthase
MEKEVYRVPILFVMATTNKAFIFDLAPGQSLIEFLLGAVRETVGIERSAFSGNVRVSFHAARSIG